MSIIVWVDKPLVLAIHDRQLAEHGGSSGLRDEGLLESALTRPQQLHAHGESLPDLAELAASLAYGIARNRPFVDGNKRTAIAACETFIELNGASFEADDAEIFPMLLALAEGKLKQAEFAEWLRGYLRVSHAPGVQEPKSAYRAKAKAGTSAAKPRRPAPARKRRTATKCRSLRD